MPSRQVIAVPLSKIPAKRSTRLAGIFDAFECAWEVVGGELIFMSPKHHLFGLGEKLAQGAGQTIFLAVSLPRFQGQCSES